MAEYRPEWKAMNYNDINRKLTHDEFERARLLAQDPGLELC